VLRGSAWDTMSDYVLRLTARSSADPGDRLNSWGFRCVRDDAP
jgi:formylglycine-generating enzyme required for sulfatase activity